jgi:segregation and condensation protein B
MTDNELSKQIEALLFVSSDGITTRKLSQIIEAAEEDVEAALDYLKTHLEKAHGLRLTTHSGKHELVTSPVTKTAVNKFLESQSKTDLSRPVLETLAIIAWKQPVSKAAIEDIRGVASDQSLRTLLSRDLIMLTDTSQRAAQQPTYMTTARFLHHFGLSSPQDLPPLPDISSDSPRDGVQTTTAVEEDHKL